MLTKHLRTGQKRFCNTWEAWRFLVGTDLFKFCKPCWMSYAEWFQTKIGKRELDGTGPVI